MADLTPPESQDIPPLILMPEIPHLDTGPWQQSYYEGGNPAPLGVWEKLAEGGAVDPHTGRHTGDGFPDTGPWRQM